MIEFKTEVDFKLLLALANEIPDCDNPYAVLITEFAMCDIPMSEAVIQLGIVCNCLVPGYRNGWSEEEKNSSEPLDSKLH